MKQETLLFLEGTRGTCKSITVEGHDFLTQRIINLSSVIFCGQEKPIYSSFSKDHRSNCPHTIFMLKMLFNRVFLLFQSKSFTIVEIAKLCIISI